MTELKPCPFCDSQNIQIVNLLEVEPELEIVRYTQKNWNTRCGDCGTIGTTGRTPKESIEAWNRRVTNENI